MSDAAHPSPAPRDRSTLLTVFGALQIALGALCALLVPMAALPLLPAMRRQIEATGETPADPRGVFMGMLLYAVMAVFFVWMGVGAILKRRWVRPIMLSVSWLWLAAGVVASLAAAYLLPRMLRASFDRSPGMPEGAGAIVGVMLTAFLGIFYVLLPLAFVLFYRSPHVKATLDTRDPVRRWTDACPPPVLGLCILLVLTAVGMLGASVFGVFPVFTMLVKGPVAIAFIVVLAGIYSYFARAAYRLEPIGWWGPLVAFTLMTVSGLVYFAFGDVETYFAALGVQGEQARMFRDSGLMGGPLMIANCVIWLVVLGGYFFWVRRYFLARSTPART